jgi:hypothetical protein
VCGARRSGLVHREAGRASVERGYRVRLVHVGRADFLAGPRSPLSAEAFEPPGAERLAGHDFPPAAVRAEGGGVGHGPPHWAVRDRMCGPKGLAMTARMRGPKGLAMTARMRGRRHLASTTYRSAMFSCS